MILRLREENKRRRVVDFDDSRQIQFWQQGFKYLINVYPDNVVVKFEHCAADLILEKAFSGDREAKKILTQAWYNWRGETYPSLSSIARAITGAHWNGWAFFGLRSRTKEAPANG